MSTFLDSTTLDNTGPGAFAGEVTEDWLQGKGAFGGWLLAAAARQFEAEAGQGFRPLALQAHFCAPCKPGPVALTVETQRRGRRVVTFSARATQGDTVTTFFSSTWGQVAEPRVAYQDDAMPEAPPFATVDPAPYQPPMPVFLQHFAVRFTGGGLPYSGHQEAAVRGWVGLQDGEQVPYDAALVAAIADVFPPGALTRADGFVGAASVSLQVSFATDPRSLDVAPAAPLLVDCHSRWSEAGYSEDLTSLWTSEGRLAARCHQVMALL